MLCVVRRNKTIQKKLNQNMDIWYLPKPNLRFLSIWFFFCTQLCCFFLRSKVTKIWFIKSNKNEVCDDYYIMIRDRQGLSFSHLILMILLVCYFEYFNNYLSTQMAIYCWIMVFGCKDFIGKLFINSRILFSSRCSLFCWLFHNLFDAR